MEFERFRQKYLLFVEKSLEEEKTDGIDFEDCVVEDAVETNSYRYYTGYYINTSIDTSINTSIDTSIYSSIKASNRHIQPIHSFICPYIH